jgi:Transposase
LACSSPRRRSCAGTDSWSPAAGQRRPSASAWPWSTTSVDASSSTPLGHRGRGRSRDPLYGIRRVLRRHRTRLSAKARDRLEAGLIAGDPDGGTTLAWTIAQQLMDLYRLDDPALARNHAEQLIGELRECPIPELARLGRTLHAWRVELCAHFDHPAVSNGPIENLNLKIKNTKRSPADTATSLIAGYDRCSTTAAFAKVTHRHESGPALPASLRRAG